MILLYFFVDMKNIYQSMRVLRIGGGEAIDKREISRIFVPHKNKR